jgi:hypothetical protein
MVWELGLEIDDKKNQKMLIISNYMFLVPFYNAGLEKGDVLVSTW